MRLTDDEIKLALEQSEAEDQERRFVNRSRSIRMGFKCWGGPDCPHCGQELLW